MSHQQLFLSIGVFIITVPLYAQCPTELTYEEMDCGWYEFTLENANSGAEIFWNFGHTFYDSDDTAQVIFFEPGEYSIYVVYSDSTCMGETYFLELNVPDCGQSYECGLDVIYYQDIDTVILNATSSSIQAEFEWVLNGQVLGVEDSFSISLSEQGYFDVCVNLESPTCPIGASWCHTWIVGSEEACQFELTYEPLDSCGWYEFSVDEFSGSYYTWNFGDSAYNSFSSTQIVFLEPGMHEVYVVVNGSNYPLDCDNTPLYVEVEVTECGELECSLEVEVVETTDSILFYASNFPGGALIEWTVNGDLSGSGDQFIIIPNEPGVYEVCAMYETPECPEGVFWCETVVVEGCPYELIVEETDECGCYNFAINEPGASNSYMWNLGDTVFTSSSHTVSYCFESGFQSVYVQIVNSNYPDCNNAPLVYEWEVLDCDSECTLNVEVLEDGDVLYFYPFNYPDNATIFWSVNGESSEPGEEFTFDLTEPGTYQICAAYETPECPEGVFWCETFNIEGEGDCPGEGDFGFDMIDCDSYIFEIGSFVEGAEVYWNFGDGDDEWAGHVADHTYNEDGIYTVWALYYSPFCEDSVYFQETIEVDCEGENDCELDMEVLQDGDILYLTPFNYPDNATIFWSVNGEGSGPGEEFTFELNEPGTYQICAAYETPECPEGVFWCETWIVEDEGCPYELIVEDTDECGCYDFAISESGAGSSYMWNLGDTVFTSSSHTVSYCFEPGFQTMYVQIMDSNYPDCNASPLVHQWEVPECEDPDCTWFAFEVATNAEDLLPFELEWEMTEQNGTVAGSGSVYLSGDTTTFTGDVCLVPGCYTLTLSSDFPIGLGDFEFDFPTIPGVPIAIDWIQDDDPYTLHSQIDLDGDCDWTVGIDENSLENVAVYPVPATDILNIRLAENASTEIRLYDTAGKLLRQEIMQQSGTIDVSNFPAGYYLLQLQQGKAFKTFSVPLLN